MYTFAEPSVLIMTKYAKEHFPEKPVVVGGNHATFSSDFLLDPKNKTGIDIVVRGEGEWTMEELSIELKKENSDLSKIKGITYRNEVGEIIHNPPRQRGDLSELPPLDYSLVQKPKEIDIVNFNHNVMFTRACKGNCAFCASPEMWTRNITETAIKNFESELNFLVENNVRVISILDDDILVEKETFKKIIPTLAAVHEVEPTVKFIAQTRVDHLRNDANPTQTLEKMKQAGIKRLYIGIESGSQKILNEMRKGYKVEWVREACKNIKNAGIEVGGFWLFGHPGATKDEEEKSLTFLEELLQNKLLDDLEPHIIVPFPGTSVAKDPRIQIIDYDKKHYGILNNQPVYNLIDPETGKIELSSQEIRSFLERALVLRKEYLGVVEELPTRPLEKIK